MAAFLFVISRTKKGIFATKIILIFMYQALKKIFKSLIPSAFLRENELFFRSIVAFFYKGTAYQCNLCGYKLSKFVVTENYGSICPKCGSISRNRRLYAVLQGTLENKRILHFSPSKSLRNKIQNMDTKEYITSDYLGEFKAMKNLNIEDINEPDNYFDVILCYHVLEHVSQDTKAMNELYRILVPNGLCYIQTPFKSGDIYEDDTMVTKEDRLKHFGQEDHLRVYSVSGLSARLEQAGFKVEILNFNESSTNKFGLSENEHIILAQKAMRA